jgi:hypothetical protein
VHASAAAVSGSTDQDAQLVATWQRYSKLLSASGSIQLSRNEPLNLFYISAPQSDASSPAHGLISFPLADSSSSNSTNVDAAAAALRQLVAAAVPSPFGKGSETMYDPSVRTAAEIKAAHLALNKSLPPPEVGCPCRTVMEGGSFGTWLLGCHCKHGDLPYDEGACAMEMRRSCMQMHPVGMLRKHMHCRCTACLDVDAAVSQRALLPCCPEAGDLLLRQQLLLLLLLFPPLQVLEEVRVLLQPNAGGVVAELDKLNVYGPGLLQTALRHTKIRG